MNNNAKITSIKIRRTSWQVLQQDDISEHVLVIYSKGITHILNKGFKNSIEKYEYAVDFNTLDRFFDLLASKIKVQDWDLDYSVEVCDGWAWECTITYSDNTIKNVVGTVQPPPRAEEMKDQIKQLVAFKVEPWLF